MAQKKRNIHVDGTDIRLYTKGEGEYICITDMARKFNERTDILIQRWLRNSSTIEFL